MCEEKVEIFDQVNEISIDISGNTLMMERYSIEQILSLINLKCVQLNGESFSISVHYAYSVTDWGQNYGIGELLGLKPKQRRIHFDDTYIDNKSWNAVEKHLSDIPHEIKVSNHLEWDAYRDGKRKKYAGQSMILDLDVPKTHSHKIFMKIQNSFDRNKSYVNMCLKDILNIIVREKTCDTITVYKDTCYFSGTWFMNKTLYFKDYQLEPLPDTEYLWYMVKEILCYLKMNGVDIKNEEYSITWDYCVTMKYDIPEAPNLRKW